MRIQPLDVTDIEAIARLQPAVWSDIRIAFRLYSASEFASPVKAVHDDRIIGIGNVMVFEDTAWLSHIIVDADYRRRGIATAIVGALLEHVHRRGVATSCLLSTSLGEPLYMLPPKLVHGW